ncbi:MAG: transposase family protein [Nakamurella sp.]
MPAASSSPIHPVVDQLIDLVGEFVLPTQLLIPALATVVDPRHRRGIRHRLPALLALSVCAVIAGARSFTAIAQWAADLPPHLSSTLGAGDKVPSESAFRHTLQRLDADHLDQVLGQWAAAPGGAACGRWPSTANQCAVPGPATGVARTCWRRSPTPTVWSWGRSTSM